MTPSAERTPMRVAPPLPDRADPAARLGHAGHGGAIAGPGAAPGRLPALRQDVSLRRGRPDRTGAPRWILWDPIRSNFFQLSWPAFEILSRWSLDDPERIAAAVSAETTLAVSGDDVRQVVGFLVASQLTQASSAAAREHLFEIAERRRHRFWQWLLHHYLFFRIPLVRPDALLTTLLPLVRWLGGLGFRLISLAATLCGLFMVSRQWDVFAATFIDRISWSGFAAFAAVLVVAKFLHELGHAFAAKAHGCRVPAMGIAFLVMWPVLYTDVNEVWLLTSRRARLWVGGAGILTELALAGWATFAWALLPDGDLRAAAFMLAAATWISSLMVNLSPFMRFDGYFLLMDALDLPNLHRRSFALARWWIREMLFGVGRAMPEYFPLRIRAFLIVFAIIVWTYRLVVFLSVAILVYHFFIKIVGLLLFFVEIFWFVLGPLLAEFRVWVAWRADIMKGRRTVPSLAVATLLIAAALMPWNERISLPAVLTVAERYDVFVPSPAKLVGLDVTNASRVRAGDVLARFDDPDLAHAMEKARAHVLQRELAVAATHFEDNYLRIKSSSLEALGEAMAELATAERQTQRLTLTSPLDGVVCDLAPDLLDGQWIGPKSRIMTICAEGRVVVDALVDEEDLPRIAIGASAWFLAEGTQEPVASRVVSLAPMPTGVLKAPELATLYGGAVAVRPASHALVPERAVYGVRLESDRVIEAPVRRRGVALVKGEPRSLARRLYLSVAAAFLREFGV